jgi:putative membrane protein
VSGANVLWSAAGGEALVLALTSPLNPPGGTRLSAHMAQHGLLIGVAPALFLLGRPGVAFAWALVGARTIRHFASTAWRALGGFGGALVYWTVKAIREQYLKYPGSLVR